MYKKETFDSLIEAFPSATLICDQNGIIKKCNYKFGQMLGYGVEKLLGRKLQDMMERVSREKFMTFQQKEIHGESEKFTLLKKNEEELLATLFLEAVEIEGSPLLMVCISNDLTFMQVKDHEQDYKDKICKLQKMHGLGMMTRNIAHDLNNLLMIINGNLELLRMDFDKNSDYSGCLDSMGLGVSQLGELTQQILTYSEDNGFVKEDADISELIKEMLPLLQASVSSGITIGFKVRNTLPISTINKPGIRQVVLNLVSNAMKAIEESDSEHGKISISTGITMNKVDSTPDFLDQGNADNSCDVVNYAFIKISDNGKGVDVANREKLFDDFFTTNHDEGSGIGLSVVKDIVTEHDGHILVKSKLNKGTTFTVLLPVARELSVVEKDDLQDGDETAETDAMTEWYRLLEDYRINSAIH